MAGSNTEVQQPTQEELNYNLYLAALKNDTEKMCYYLSLGAQVVEDIKNNGALRKPIAWNYYYTSANQKNPFGHFIEITPMNALYCALFYDNLMLVALCAQSLQNMGTCIDSSYYTVADYINRHQDYSNKPQKKQFDLALREPDKVLAALADEYKKLHPFVVITLEKIQFERAPKMLNTLIAHIYKRAESLFNSPHFWTAGKRDKARAILNQLSYLHAQYHQSDKSFTIDDYLNDTTSGQSLAKMLQEKSTANPFAVIARSL